MVSTTKWVLFFLVVVWIFAGIAPVAGASDVPRMSKEELKTLLGDSQVVVIDVRQGMDWQSSEFKIKGAVRHEPGDFENWSNTYPKDKILVLYCA